MPGIRPVPAVSDLLSAPSPLFDAILTPNDSGTRYGRALFVGVLTAYAAITLTAWLWLGAWPMAAHGLLVVAFVVWSVFGDARRRRQSERIRVWPDRTRVERTDRAGRRAVSDWQTGWLRVRVEHGPADGPRVSLGSHGRWEGLGGFLTARERLDLAAALKAELARASNGTHDAWTPTTAPAAPTAESIPVSDR